MQKVHVLLQPTLMETQAANTESRLVGSVDGKTSSDSRISTCDSSCTRARSSRTGSEPMLCVPKTTSTQGARFVMVSRSFCARQPPTATCMPGCWALRLATCPRFPYSLLSAFSRTAHVLNTTRSGIAAPPSASDVCLAYPAVSRSPDSRSLSWTFIWHP